MATVNLGLLCLSCNERPIVIARLGICRRCYQRIRYSRPDVKAKQLAKAKEHAKSHAEQHRKHAKKSHRRKKEREKTTGKSTRPVRDSKTRMSEYYQANKESFARYWHERRARLHGAEVEKVDLRDVYERDEHICGICGGDVIWEEFSLDHIIPLADGGQHVLSNLQTSHRSCNYSKGNRK